MLKNTNRQPVPGPLCAAYAPLLAALDDLTDARLAEDTRNHLAGCAWCRAQRATYDRFDEALRLHFAPDAAPFPTIHIMESLISDAPDLLESDVTDATEDDEPDESDDDLHLTITPLAMPAHLSRAPRPSWRLATAAASLAALLVISLLGGLLLLTHERPTAPTSQRPTATTPAIPGAQADLAAIGMSSATDGWAFAHNGSGMNQGLNTALHYTNGKWVAVQSDINGSIEVVKMLAPDDGWAIGNKIYHYEGTHWLEMNDHLPDYTGAYFDAISVVSPTDIWFAGTFYDNQALMLHYDGHNWKQQPVSTLAGMAMMNITSVSMVSASEGWAVGTATTAADNNGNFNQTGFVLRYSQGGWRMTQTIPNADLRTIAMGSADAGWFGGEKQVRNTQFPAIGPTWQKPTLWRYSDGRWMEVAAPLPANAGGVMPAGQIASVTMFSATDGWLFAALQDAPQSLDGSATLTPDVFHLEQGRWVQIATPVIQQRQNVFMSQVSFVSPDEFWGVGNTIVRDAPDNAVNTVTPLLVHYKQGVWSVVRS